MRTFLLGLCALTLGCGGADDDEGPARLAPAHLYAVPGCESLEQGACDILREACQVRLLAMAACLRGDEPGELPSITVITQAEYAAALNEDFESEPRPNPDHEERAFTLLGLVTAGAFGAAEMTRQKVDFVAGFYRWDTKAITLIDREQQLETAYASSLLVHEFVHMLQDRQVSIPDWAEPYALSEDSLLAVTSVIEGEAELLEARHFASLTGVDPAKLDYLGHFASRIRASESEFLEDDSPYAQTYARFPYAWGGRSAFFAWQSAGTAGLRERFTTPPTTSQQLMASEQDLYVPDFVPIEPELPNAPDAWSAVSRIVLGAWGLFLAVERRTREIDTARALALAWRGDALFTYAGASGTDTALVWRLAVADEASAVAVASSFGASAQRSGLSVTIAKATSSASLDWAFTPEAN